MSVVITAWIGQDCEETFTDNDGVNVAEAKSGEGIETFMGSGSGLVVLVVADSEYVGFLGFERGNVLVAEGISQA